MKKLLKISAIALGSIIGLIALLLVAASLVLTPERLTRWVREYGSDYLVDGRVDARLVDLTIWSTFPHAELTVEKLLIENLSPRVPSEFRTVASVERINGRVNLAALLMGRISISHVDIDRPCATLWNGADSTATSLTILPPTEKAAEPELDEPLSLPDLRINRFLISGDALIRYVSEPDSLDLTLTIRQTRLDAADGIPQYTVHADSRVGAHPLLTDTLTLAIDGGIGWDPSAPLAIELHKMQVNIDSLQTLTSLRADFNAPARLDALDFELKPMALSRLAELAAQLPPLKGIVPAVEGPAAIALRARLRNPYILPADSLTLPDLTAHLQIADAPIAIPAYYLDLTNLALDATASISSAGIDASTIDLHRLQVKFPATDFTLTAKARNLESNPAAEGCFRGKVNFSNMNPQMWRLIGMRLRGALDADIDFNLSLADLTPNTFHRARLDGEANLIGFEALMPADSIAAAATRARLRFGSDMKLGRADSLLAATLSVDSAWVAMPELTARMADLRLGFGVTADANLADTTRVLPMGGGLSIRLLRYQSRADSTRALLRDLKGQITLTRFKGNDRLPLLRTSASVGRMAATDGTSRVSLRNASISASAYRTPRRARRPMTHTDSLRRAARRDSLILNARSGETIDLGVDRSAITLLRRWHVNGSVSARAGALRTPLLPLRMRMKDLNLTLSPDSLILNSLYVQAGQSDLAIAGQITNMQRALGRRLAPEPLHLRLDLLSDTLNINELTQAAFRGAAYQAKADPARRVSLDAEINDDGSDDGAVGADEAEMMAVVIPSNIDAELNFAASNIIYSTMKLTDFYGTVLVADGAANLSDLHASTDIGSVDLNMLYRAPERSDVSFGMTMDLNRFHIGKVTEMMPALDSIMPILNTLGGVINASVAATTPVDSMLNIRFPELKAMVRLEGDSLKVLDEQTFKTVSKWLLFHDKKKNMIDHMDVRLAVDNNRMTLYPFMFDFDRYRIGVMGGNDMNLNLDYHVSILKSPIPFKFGINIKGTADKMKIRLGRARFKEQMAGKSVELSDTIRVNLAKEIRDVFRRGARKARLAPLNVGRPEALQPVSEETDTVSADEKRYFIQQGLIEAPADSAAIKQNQQ